MLARVLTGLTRLFLSGLDKYSASSVDRREVEEQRNLAPGRRWRRRKDRPRQTITASLSFTETLPTCQLTPTPHERRGRGEAGGEVSTQRVTSQGLNFLIHKHDVQQVRHLIRICAHRHPSVSCLHAPVSCSRHLNIHLKCFSHAMFFHEGE